MEALQGAFESHWNISHLSGAFDFLCEVQECCRGFNLVSNNLSKAECLRVYIKGLEGILFHLQNFEAQRSKKGTNVFQSALSTGTSLYQLPLQMVNIFRPYN